MQNLREFDPWRSSSERRWHPKLTPYRLLVLGTTIGVGTIKAVLAQHGDQGASTTLEWVSGVVIFFILYSMSTYDESPKDLPFLLGWLFSVDCMDYLWRLLSLLRVPRPSYSSDPEPTPRPDVDAHDKSKSNAVPITLYRLFVCVTTAVFGLTKAMMTYFGFSAGANWVDWTLGVVVTSLLFVLGLYENNNVGMWYTFFVPDYAVEVQHGLAAVSIALLNILLLTVGILMISFMWDMPFSAFLSTNNALDPISSLTPLTVLRGRLFNACFTLYIALLLVVIVVTGVLSIAGVLWTSGLPRWKDAGDWMTGQRPARKNGYRKPGSQGRLIWGPIVNLTLLLTSWLFGCAVFLAFWVVSAAANVEEGCTLLHSNSDPDSKSKLGYLAFLGLCVLFQLSGAVATAYLMWLVLSRVLLPPLWM